MGRACEYFVVTPKREDWLAYGACPSKHQRMLFCPIATKRRAPR